MPKRTRQNSIRLSLLTGALLLTFGCGREDSNVAVSKAPSSLSELPAPTPQLTERRTGLQWEGRSGSFGFSWNGKDLEISTDTQKFGLFNAAFEQRVQFERRLNDVKDCLLAGYFQPVCGNRRGCAGYRYCRDLPSNSTGNFDSRSRRSPSEIARFWLIWYR